MDGRSTEQHSSSSSPPEYRPTGRPWPTRYARLPKAHEGSVPEGVGVGTAPLHGRLSSGSRRVIAGEERQSRAASYAIYRRYCIDIDGLRNPVELWMETRIRRAMPALFSALDRAGRPCLRIHPSPYSITLVGVITMVASSPPSSYAIMNSPTPSSPKYRSAISYSSSRVKAGPTSASPLTITA